MWVADLEGGLDVSLTTTIKCVQDIMRKDVGAGGDAQRIGRLVWLLLLKIWNDRERELELVEDDFRSPLLAVKPRETRRRRRRPSGCGANMTPQSRQCGRSGVSCSGLWGKGGVVSIQAVARTGRITSFIPATFYVLTAVNVALTLLSTVADRSSPTEPCDTPPRPNTRGSVPRWRRPHARSSENVP